MSPSNKSDSLLTIIGIFFIMWGILAIVKGIQSENPSVIFWLCYPSLILIGISILKRDSFLLSSQLNIISVPLIIWTIDFISYLIMGKSLLGVVDYFFDNTLTIDKIVSLQHIFTLPLAFYVLSKIKMKRNDSWIISFSQLMIIFISSMIFSPETANVNCVYKPCFNLAVNTHLYQALWFIIWFIMVSGTNQIINRIKIFRK